MRVLVASKFWYRRGGLERVMFDEISALEAAGHQTAHLSTTHPQNVDSPWDEYFVPYLELGSGHDIGIGGKITAAMRMFHNGAAADSMRRLIKEFGPDLVHIHGIHRQLSPSIIAVARAAGVPVIQTLHDYHHVCPADTLLRGGTEPCMPPACRRGHYGPAISNKCMQGSAARSALSATETWYQRKRRSYESSVTRFIAPSRFMAEVMQADGWEQPIDVVPNAVPLADEAHTSARGTDARPYALYAGRLAPEKGIGVALEAARKVGVKVVVAGEGPMEDELKERFPESEFVGRVSGERIETLLAGARAALVPSIWFENASMAVLEALAHGVPLVTVRIGGIPEQVEDGVEGFLSEAGDVDQMAGSLSRLFSDEALAIRMGEAGRERIRTEFSPERHQDLLFATYDAAVNA